jgi:hypothetical protein
MWTVAHYMPVALFSLKPASATSSGGKTLLCPTPFALKMSLLDAVMRIRGLSAGESMWRDIRDLHIRLHLSHPIAVINTFTKIVRPKKNGPSDDVGTGLQTPLGSTIAYREYVSYGGPIGIALQTMEGTQLPTELTDLLFQINYFGKRGGFMQLLDMPSTVEDASVSTEAGWIPLTNVQEGFSFRGTLQMLDDCSAKLTFDQANIYSGKRITLGKDRIIRHVVLPYQLTRSSRGFSLYERLP